MAQNDWTVVSETPATASSGWEVVSESVNTYKNLKPTGEPVDYTASATAMEGTPAEPRERTVYSGSVLDRVKLPEPQFDPAEAARLSRREYAERTMRPRERLQYLEPTPEDQITRSAARAAVDTTIGLLQGAVAIPKGITENIPFDNPLSKFFQSAYEAGERAKSPFLRSQAANRAALLDRVRQSQGELAASRAAFSTMFSPAGADVVMQGAGSLLPTVGMSFVGLGSTSLAAMNALANAGDAAQQAAARLADMPPEQWSNSAVYQELRERGMGHRDAVRMLAPIYALPSQAVGGLTGFISGSTGLERALVRGGGSRAGRAATELVGEEAETLTPIVTANATRMLLDDKQKLFEGTGQAAVETAAGAAPGAALAAAVRPGRPAKPVPTAAQVMAEKGFGAEQWQVVSEQPSAPTVAPSATAEVPAPAAPAEARMREQQRAVEELEAAIEGEPSAVEAPEAVEAKAQRPQEPAAAVKEEPSVSPGFVRVYHTGSKGEGEGGRWVSTNREYAENYRADLPLFYTDIPADDPRVNNPDYPEQGATQGFTFNFELTPKEATTLKPISKAAEVAVKPDAEIEASAVQEEAKSALVEEPAAPPTLDTTGQPEMRGRHPQVVAAGRLFKEGKMSRADFEKYVDYYYPIQEIEADKVYEPASDDKIREALREGDKPFLNAPIADGTRVGLRMDIPALRKGVPVVSIHEGKSNINPKTGEPYKSAGKRISYAPTGYITNVEFAPRDQYKSLEMGIEPAKEPLQTVEGVWVNKTPQEVFAKVKELMGQPGWTQIGFDPARHGYFYDRKTKQPVVSADEVYQVGNFLLAKNVKYAPKEEYLYSIEPQQRDANFKRWFGDSKVVDEEGKPLVIYHHTPESFSEFIPGGRDPELSGVAIWMTPETDASKAPFAHQLYSALRQGRGIDAKGYVIPADAVRRLESGELTDQQRKVIRKRVDEAIDAARVSGVNTMPLYASIKNPLILRGKESSKATLMYPDRVKELKAQGYDGVMAYDDNNVLTEVVAFEPNQVKSAIGNIGTFGPETNITLDISTGRSEAGDTSTRSPSVKRKVRTLNTQRKAGKLTDEQFAEEVDAALEADEAAKDRKPIPERARGADFIRQKLLEAKRRGEISAEAVDFAEWFIRQNERLVDDLGISIRTPKVQGTAGFYAPFQRVMTLMKETAGDQTAVHEILHHLERMMPADVQQAIRKAWLRGLTAEQKKATKDAERLFFALLDNHHFGSGNIADVEFARASLIIRQMMQRGALDSDQGGSMKAAIELLRNGDLPIKFYQYVNPSEFWAVNASDIMQGRFNAVRGGVLARLKNWLKEFVERAKDLFGMRSDAPLIRALDSLMKGDGKFVSEKLLSEGESFLQIGKNIYNQRPLVDWTMPDETKLEGWIYKLQNKQIDLKRATQEIEKAKGQIEDKWDAYLQEELYHGRTARATAEFLGKEVRPLLQAMQKEGVSIAEIDTYLHNRHAEERNEQIAKVNDLMPDGGSGILTQDARDYLANLSPDKKAKYERIAKMVDGITQGTRDYLIESGLEEEATVKQWEKTYGNYVPLNREDVEYSTLVGAGTGRGFSVRGPSTRRATGSLRRVVDILPNIIMQRERAIVRGEKNRVAVALYGLAVQNPSPDVWLAVNPEAKQSRKRITQELIDMGLTAKDAEGLMQEPAQNVVDPNTGLVTQRVNPVLRGANNVLAARINGKDRYVFFNTVNPRAVRMVQSLLNIDADQLGEIETQIAYITRYFSNINTQYNPIFGPYNFLRDVQGAAIQLDGTPLEDSRAEVLSPVNIFRAARGIYQSLRTERYDKQQLMTPWADLWLEFQREGGQTGYRDMFSRTQERVDALQKELDRMSQGVIRKTGNAVLDWLSDYNEMLENAVRLTAYKAALDKGLSKERAASVAKNLTVNFNRKGQWGVRAGAWYSFFNSAVQGTTRMLGTLAKMERPGDLKSIRLQRIGKIVIYGGLMLGAAQALMLAAMGYDEGEPPDFVKDRNVIIPIGDGKYLAWPLPLGYHVIPAIGRILTEWAISGGKDSSKRVVHLTSLLLDAFNPIGNAGLSAQSIAPTIFDPIVALFENRDWTGKKIAKEDFNKLDPTPGYTRAKENASRVGKELSYYLNVMSGGDKDTAGVVNLTPDQIDYLIGQAFGGLGREALKVAKTAEATVTGEELAPHNIPLAGRFYGNTKAGYAESSKFYQNIERLNVLENQLQGRQKRGESTAEFVQQNPEVRLIAASNQIERNISALRKRKEKLIKDNAPRASVRAVENQITAQMKKLNEKMDELEKQKR